MTTRRTQAHQHYQLADGSYAPGGTTVLGLRAKPQLVLWANRLGLQGIDSTKYRDEMADVGTLAHAMILAHLQGKLPDTSDYSQNQVDLAENCFLSYLAWERGRKIEPLRVEEHIVSEEWRCGGTSDFYGLVDGRLTIMDYKTGGIYPESEWQIAAYAHLLAACGERMPVQGIVLSVPRAETEVFQEVTVAPWGLDRGWEIFKHLLAIYWLERDNKPLTR